MKVAQQPCQCVTTPCDCKDKETTTSTTTTKQGLTTTQKWVGVIGLTLVAYYLLYKFK
jgi:hypothetical protein